MAGKNPVFISFVRAVDQNSASALLATVNQAIANGHDEINILISSPGGQIIPGFGVYNQLMMLPVTINTHNIGSVNSIATVIYMAGKRRTATSNATFLFHGTAWGFGHAGDITKRQLLESVSALQIDEKRMQDVIVSKTKLKSAEIEKLMLDGETKDINFAKNTGIIHEVIDIQIPANTSIIQI